MHIRLLKHTPDPERVCAEAARLCYNPVNIDELGQKLTPEQVSATLKHVIKAGHLSVVEHASFTFAIEGVSRALTHQLVRHRIASYSQQSQRHVSGENFNYIIPPSVKANAELKEKFERKMADAAESYKELADAGVAKEDARFVLPNACETKIVMTMNARSLLNFFELRCCTAAQWEIRALACEMLRMCKETAPVIFENAGPTCVYRSYCGEGKRSCGRWKNIPKAFLKE
ncbi:FAD-dependent thymidylate synthase [Candidatus Micrarchaeota archaeon]|nr:FAD-dependent thymidylate synthase [Candidatus Micrarchaeota archaeon]